MKVSSENTIKYIKDSILIKENLKEDYKWFYLKYEGKILEEEKCIKDYGITKDKTLWMMLRLKGGVTDEFDEENIVKLIENYTNSVDYDGIKIDIFNSI